MYRCRTRVTRARHERATTSRVATLKLGRCIPLALWAVLDSMPMSISIEEVRHVARLARLELDETEVMSFQGELNALIGHFVDIQVIDVRGFEPASHAVALANVWAEDEPGFVLQREKVLRNSAVSRAGLFVVPQIIED